MPENKTEQWHETLAKGYQPGDMRVRWFVVAVICFVAFAAITHTWLWFLVKADAYPPRQVDHPLSAVSGYATEATETPAAPPLQPTPDHDRLPSQDLEALRRGEDKVFESLGWRVNEVTHQATLPDDLVRQVVARFRKRAPSTAPSSKAAPAAATTSEVITPIPGVDQGVAR